MTFDPSLDLIRLAVVVTGGVSFGVGFVTLREAIRISTRQQAFAIRLFLCVHLAIVLYIFGVLAERSGQQLSWYTPAAGAIFTAKLILMWAIREHVIARDVDRFPPERRAEDRVRRRVLRGD